MNGDELRQIQTALGLSPESVCNEAGVSIGSLYKVYNGKHVRERTIRKVRDALARISERVQSQPRNLPVS